MFRIELTDKQIALEQIRDLLRSHESSGQPPSKALLLELHKTLSRLSESYPETKVSPLSIKARKLLKELDLKNIGALEKKIRRKENRRKRKNPEPEAIPAAEPAREKSEDKRGQMNIQANAHLTPKLPTSPRLDYPMCAQRVPQSLVVFGVLPNQYYVSVMERA